MTLLAILKSASSCSTPRSTPKKKITDSLLNENHPSRPRDQLGGVVIPTPLYLELDSMLAVAEFSSALWTVQCASLWSNYLWRHTDYNDVLQTIYYPAVMMSHWTWWRSRYNDAILTTGPRQLRMCDICRYDVILTMMSLMTTLFQL